MLSKRSSASLVPGCCHYVVSVHTERWGPRCAWGPLLADTAGSLPGGGYWGLKLRSWAEKADGKRGLFQDTPWVAGARPARGPVVLSEFWDISGGF